MGRVRETLFRYPAIVLVTIIVLPFVAVLAYSEFAKPPRDRILNELSDASGFTLQSDAPGLPYSLQLGRFGQDNLSPLRALHYGFDWIQVKGRVYKSTFPSRGMLWRPEFVATNNIVVREEFSTRFDVKWINSLTTEVYDTATDRPLARRTHWSSDEEPHPDNSPGSSIEFVGRVLGIDAPRERRVSTVPVRVVGSVAPDKTPPAQIHTGRKRAILYGCDDQIASIDAHVSRGIRGPGWEYTGDFAIAAVYCQNQDIFVYYDPDLYRDRVLLEWFKRDGTLVGHFDILLAHGSNERRKTPSWVNEFSFDERVIRLQIASGRNSGFAGRADLRRHYSPIVIASIEIDTKDADFSQVLTNGNVERPIRAKIPNPRTPRPE